MYYKDLEEKDLSTMSRTELEKWIETLYQKGKQIQHSEMRHKHDSVFWKRQLSEKITGKEMIDLCKQVDVERELIKKD